MIHGPIRHHGVEQLVVKTAQTGVIATKGNLTLLSATTSSDTLLSNLVLRVKSIVQGKFINTSCSQPSRVKPSLAMMGTMFTADF